MSRVVMKAKDAVLNSITILCVVTGAGYLEAGTLTSETPTEKAPNRQSLRRRGSVTFSGEVRRGQKFDRQIGEHLFFRLIPHELGWMISVANHINSDRNFCAVVTPPYRGINPIYIEGWHFRNSDNTGPNEAGSKNVNAPQETREFHFVLDDADYQKAFDALQRTRWPHSYSSKAVREAVNLHRELSKGTGVVTIRELKLNNLQTGNHAGIDFMKFNVELTLP
jgi:hypothetical protein